MGAPVQNVSHKTSIRLVTTSLRDTWPDGGRVLVAGQWCLDYLGHDRGVGFDIKMVPYHWDDRSRLRSDYDFLHALSTQLLDELAITLDRIHGESHSTRFWRIALGYWLEYFTQVYFDRWRVLESAVATGERLELMRLQAATPYPAKSTFLDFQRSVVTPSWNERLFADIATAHFPIDVHTLPSTTKAASTAGRPEINNELDVNGVGVAQRLGIGVTRYLGRLSPPRVWIYQANLRRVPRRLFELAILQVPRQDASPSFAPSSPRSEMRQWSLAQNHNDPLVRGLGRAIAEHLPSVYLEDWAAMREAVRETWPGARSEVIFTAAAAGYDAAWSVHAATCMERGAKVVIAQHGGHHGTGAWSTLQDHEVAIADRFLSWGWTISSAPNVQAAPATRLIGQRLHRRAPEGFCLQVTVAHPQQSYWLYSTPVAGQLLHYIDDQIAFGEALSPQVRSRHRVRLYPQDFGWRVRERWHDVDPEVTFTEAAVPMAKLLEKTRLYVATYNATTFLESMSMGIPTVIFWNPHFWELSDDASPYFNALRAAGIFFDNPVSCANAVNAIWPHVEDWWASSEVSAVAREFVNRFAYVGPRPVRRLREAVLGKHPSLARA